MHIAVKKNNINAVKALIAMGYPLNSTKNNGITALGIAALKGNHKMLLLLISAVADVNCTTKSGIGALYLAIKGNSLNCTKSLVESGADIYYSSIERTDNSPLIFAIKCINLPLLEIMCSSVKIELNSMTTSKGLNLVLYACSIDNYEAASYLSGKGINLN